jgi:hypothetical protein
MDKKWKILDFAHETIGYITPDKLKTNKYLGKATKEGKALVCSPQFIIETAKKLEKDNDLIVIVKV